MTECVVQEETAGGNRRSMSNPTVHEGENKMSVARPGLDLRYVDYTVEIRQGKNAVHLGLQDGVPIRWCGTFFRIPSEKRFVAILHTGISDDEQQKIESWAVGLPFGEWAQFPDLWKRYRRGSDGRYGFFQNVGLKQRFDFLQHELEMLLEDSIDSLSVSAP